jgi:hypothetical protein
MTMPTHDNNAAASGDDYATTTITFITPSGNADHVVQLLFGGHLAPAAQLRGWGAGLGAGSVSGGPYHIKWAAVDGASAGNRDNQIMSGAIIPIVAQGVTMSTTPSPTSPASISTVTNASDTATLIVGDAAHPPTGTEVFDLYGPFSSQPLSTDAPNQCVDPATAVTGNRVFEASTSTFTPDAVIPTKFTATSGNHDLSMDSNFAPGWYQWVAHYVPGTDQYNLSSDGGCYTAGEQLHVTAATPTATSSQTVTDAVTVTGFGTLTGHVSWYLYPSLLDCQSGTNVTGSDVYGSPASPDTDSNNALSSGIATSKGITPSPAAGGTTYFWKVTYDGDTNNASGTVEPCGTQTVTIQNAS